MAVENVKTAEELIEKKKLSDAEVKLNKARASMEKFQMEDLEFELIRVERLHALHTAIENIDTGDKHASLGAVHSAEQP